MTVIVTGIRGGWSVAVPLCSEAERIGRFDVYGDSEISARGNVSFSTKVPIWVEFTVTQSTLDSGKFNVDAVEEIGRKGRLIVGRDHFFLFVSAGGAVSIDSDDLPREGASTVFRGYETVGSLTASRSATLKLICT